MQIWPYPSRHCRATTLPSSHCTGDSRADSSLGGGSPAYTVTAGGVLGARVPLDAAPAIIEDRQSCVVITNHERAVSATVNLQNEWMSTSRLCRKNWIEN
jgi:hypothetical protein